MASKRKPSEPSLLTQENFIDALLAVKDKKFLTVRKSRNPFVKALRTTVRKFYGELKLDDGKYCVFLAYKDEFDEKLGMEEYRFNGPSVEVEIGTSWPDEFQVNPSDYRFCIHLKGKDFKRKDGGQGEVYIFAQDTGLAEKVKSAIEALAKASKPFGECKFKKVSLFETDVDLFTIDRHDEILIIRACSLVNSLDSLPDGVFDLVPTIDPIQARNILSNENADEMKFETEKSKQYSALFLRALQESLKKLKVKPVTQDKFRNFSTRADILNEKFKLNPSPCDFLESEDLANEAAFLLKNLTSKQALHLLKEITRSVKHLHSSLKILLFDCANFFGPLILEGFSPNQAKYVSWFFASTSSSFREKIFLKANNVQITSPPRKRISGGNNTLAVKISHPNTASLATIPPIIDVDKIPTIRPILQEETPNLKEQESLDLRIVSSDLVDDPKTDTLEKEKLILPREQISPSLDKKSEVSELIGKKGEEEEEEGQETDSISLDDFENVQEEIDALTRLCEYLRGRLRDEPNGSNSDLIRKELEVCENEIQQLNNFNFSSNTYSYINHSNNSTKSVAKVALQTSEKTSSEDKSVSLDASTISPTATSSTTYTSSPSFLDRTRYLWAESRKESLQGSTEQVHDSAVILKNTLKDIEELKSSIGDFQEVVHDKKTRETAIALISLLEENVSLRLKILSKPRESFNHVGDESIPIKPATTTIKSTPNIVPSSVYQEEEAEVSEEEMCI